MTALDSDAINSILVWKNGEYIDYPPEEFDVYGRSAIYDMICENYEDDCTVELFHEEKLDGDYLPIESLGEITVREIREFIGA